MLQSITYLYSNKALFTPIPKITATRFRFLKIRFVSFLKIMPPCTDGDRRALSDHADVIINDTDEGVSLVIENRDKVAYLLQFNFTQSENLDMRVLHKTELLDAMKCAVEIPAKTTWDLAAFDVNSDEVTSIAVVYHCRCRIRNPVTGAVEPCPTARNQERDDIPEKRIPINGSIDLVLKHGPGGYNGYIENRGPPANVSLDFGPSSNVTVSPLSKAVSKPSPNVATTDVPPGRIEFVELCPVARGPIEVQFKVLQCTQAKSPSTLPVTVEQLVKKAGTSPGAPPPPPPPPPPADDDEWDEVGGGDGEDWEHHGGGEGDFGMGGDGGVGALGGHGEDEGEWEELEGGEGSFGGGSGGRGGRLAKGSGSGSGGSDIPPPPPLPSSATTSTTQKATTTSTSSSAPAKTSGGVIAGTTSRSAAPMVGDTYAAGQLSKAFKNIHRDFGQPGPNDAGADPSKWSVYKWVLKRWDEERIARIKIEAEWKVRYEYYLKQWYHSICNICRNLLATGIPAVEYKVYRLHKECYENAAKCNMCNEILVGEYVIAKGKDGKPDTKLHNHCIEPYKQRTRPSCGICSKQIMDAKWATTGGKAFHFACRDAQK